MNQQEIQVSMEVYDKQYNEVDKNQKEVSILYFNARLKNIEQIRNFLLNLIILSSAIIVAIFPFMVKDSSYLKNLYLAIIGVVLLILADLIGIFYINKILIRENKDLKEQNEFVIQNMNKEKEMLINAMKEKRDHKEWGEEYLNFLKKIHEEEIDMRKRQNLKKIIKWFDENFSTILVYLVISGVVLIGVSFLKLDSFKFWNNNISLKTENQCFIYLAF